MHEQDVRDVSGCRHIARTEAATLSARLGSPESISTNVAPSSRAYAFTCAPRAG
jgi:hypothetical protein